MKTMVSTACSGVPSAPDGTDGLVAGAKAGPWVVERELGRGGMGAVYAVTHEDIGKRAALKVIHKRLLASGLNCDRMLLEAKVVNQVGHPNIVDIFETGNLPDGRPYIVMERLEGQSLSSRADEGKLLPDLVVTILLQICDALIAAHAAGVVHRDLKLDNVFLVDNPEDPATPKVKLLDWGIAKLIHHDVKHTVEGQLVGTPQYLSPEQARGLAVSPQTDVYSLGVMAYELFLEQLPFEAETAAEVMAMHLRATPPPPVELWPDVPPRLQDLLLAMLAKQPDQRPTSREVARRLEAVREDLERRRHGRPSPRHRTGTPVDPSRRHRVISSTAIAKTESAMWYARTRRWQYTVGVAALLASGALFWLSRMGDHAALAAPVSEATAQIEQADRTRGPAGASGRLLDVAHEVGGALRDVTTEAADKATLEVADPHPQSADMRLPVARAELLVHRTDQPAARDAIVIAPAALRGTEPRATPARSPRSSAARVAPAHPSAGAPRRGAKMDPDGTFDPYL